MSKCRYIPVSCHITVDKKYNIAVAGTGYVGLSLATLLAQHNHVTAVDIIPEKVDMINNKKSPIQDDYIEKYLAEKDLDLTAPTDGEAVIELVLKVNPDATMTIKSTIPVGYTLQQPFLWLRRILPAKRHQTAACQLP